jgi:hypothetical protein
MKRIDLFAVNAIGEPVKLAKDAVRFVDSNNYFSITVEVNHIVVTTPKGSYKVTKHPTLNIFNGKLNGHSMSVSLKKIVGELRYW